MGVRVGWYGPAGGELGWEWESLRTDWQTETHVDDHILKFFH